MVMTAGARKFALTVHVSSSVAWLGAVAAFLSLAVTGLSSSDARAVQASYLAMEITAWTVIVPLSIASPLSGIVQSLGTHWGLVRHYWVVVKLVMTIPASLVLLLHMRPIGQLGRAAGRGLAVGDLVDLRTQLVANAAAAVAVLLVTTFLSVYKPSGRTPWGNSHAARRDAGDAPATAEQGAAERAPWWARTFGVAVAALILLILVKHLASGGPRHGMG